MALISDFRFAARMLARNKGWTAVSALALALGLGTNIAIFSVVGVMVWVPLPYPDSKQLIYITQSNAEKGFRESSVSLQDTRDWAGASSLEAIAQYRSKPLAISGQFEPQHIPAMQVSPEFFPILGAKPAFGRVFTPAEPVETESRSAVISYALWQGMYRGDAAALGRDIRLDGRNYSIVGVMPEGFHFLFMPADVWIPLSVPPLQRDRNNRMLRAIARMKPGVTIAQAGAEVRSISERVEREDPLAGKSWRGLVRPIAARVIPAPARAAAGTMFGAVTFVLLIACANVASLVLARGTLRRRELAIRAALGGSRASLMRLQVMESLLVSILGCAIGMVSAIWTIPLLKRVAPPEMLIFNTVRLDWNALWVGLGLTVATAILCGLLPAWLLTGGNTADGLRSSSRGIAGGRHFALKSLVVTEIALALVLVAASTLMIRSLIRQTTSEAGFDRTNLMTAQILLSNARYPQKEDVANFYSRSLENLRREGNLESAAMVQTLPLAGGSDYARVYVEGQAETGQDRYTGDMIVSPGYFQTMRIPILAGRDLTDSDGPQAAKVAIVNQTFLKQYWPGESSPIGRRLRLGGAGDPWITVIGLARDVRHTNPFDPPRPEVYRPHAQAPANSMTLVARGRAGTNGVAGALRSAVAQVDRDQPLFRIQSMDAVLFSRQSGERATTKVLGFLAAIALVLAAIGTYGVMAYASAQRVREISIRLALGATRGGVFRLVLRGGVTLAVLGIAIGLPATYGVTPLLRGIGADLDPRDGIAYSAVAMLLGIVGAAACLIPAWRAMRVDPANVLREQ